MTSGEFRRAFTRGDVKRIALVLVAILWVGLTPVGAQAPAGGDHVPSDTQGELERLKTELEEVKRLLGQVLRLVSQRQPQGPPPGGPVRASIQGGPVLGRPDAPVTLVEFSDYQCPFCARFAATTFPVLKKDYIDTGKVRYVFRDFPLDRIHPQARKAAEAAHCAGDQGRYWEMHDRLFQHQRSLVSSQLGEHARTLGLEGAAFDECLASDKHAARVEKGLADGRAAGVDGTPGFVVARTQPGEVVEGRAIRGAQPIDVFRQLVEELLARP